MAVARFTVAVDLPRMAVELPRMAVAELRMAGKELRMAGEELRMAVEELRRDEKRCRNPREGSAVPCGRLKTRVGRAGCCQGRLYEDLALPASTRDSSLIAHTFKPRAAGGAAD